jgi:hypothetical protein
MARKAGLAPAAALEKRWDQIEAKKTDAAANAHIPAIDEQEANVFRQGPDAALKGTARTDWFQQ